jgi:menaquinone-dependent protoporphyrinogen oxidase
MNVLLAYATTHGSTTEIARSMYDILLNQGYSVQLSPVEQVKSVTGYDACVLGTPIYKGFWLPGMSHFVHKFSAELSQKPVYFWISCIRVMEIDGFEHSMKHYLRPDVLEDLNVRQFGVFAGKLLMDELDMHERATLAAHYDGYGSVEYFDGDYRNWNAIQNWTGEIGLDLQNF